ncbi:MAG: hypothetical protein AAF335_03935 [Bacteroidota bacterium]
MKTSTLKKSIRLTLFSLIMAFAPPSASASSMLGILKTAVLGSLMLTQQSSGAPPQVISINSISTGVTDHGPLEINSTGHPILAYPKGNILEMASCSDLTCASLSYETVGSFNSPATVQDVSLRLDNSEDPVMSFSLFQGGVIDNIYVFPCSSCSSFPCTTSQCLPWTISFSNPLLYTSLAIRSNNAPLVSYFYHPNLELLLGPCAIGGTFFCPTPQTISSGGRYSYMKLSSGGNPVISHYNGFLNIDICQDATCNTAINIPSIDNVFGAPGNGQVPLQLDSNDRPRVSYGDGNSPYGLKFLACDDPICTNIIINTVDHTTSSNPIGSLSSLQLQKFTEFPIMSYLSDNFVTNKLNVAICHDLYCAGSVTILDGIDSGLNRQKATFLKLTDDGEYAVISYVVGSGPSQTLKVVTIKLNLTLPPTTDPTTTPTGVTMMPSASPSKAPTKNPTQTPTADPSISPSKTPTKSPAAPWRCLFGVARAPPGRSTLRSVTYRRARSPALAGSRPCAARLARPGRAGRREC